MSRPASSEPFGPRPQLGEWLTLTVGAEERPGTYAATAQEWPQWRCTLRMRRGTPPSGEVSAWVFGVGPGERHLSVTLDDFGRLPISERMFVRYERGLLELIDALRYELSGLDPELCSEVKGMYSRTFKKDQVDWLSVYHVLGRPPAPHAREVAAQLGHLGKGLRAGDAPMAEAAHQKLTELGAAQEFGRALTRLREQE